ncbi:MAG: hypothetical protein AAFO04_28800 [Cyanobacteria bacterium J06592_8]
MKFNRLLISGKLYSTLLFSMIFLSTSPAFSQNILRQPLSQLSNQTFSEDNILAEEGGWRRFFPNSEPPEDDGSEAGDERGDSLCLIAPHNNQKGIKVWSDRPTFTWEGEITKLEIRELDSRTALWSQRISSKNQVESLSSANSEWYQVQVETELQPGQTYQWYFSDKPSGEYDEYLPIEFTVMTPTERDSITQGLQQLEQELTAQNITGDAAKLRRADYFASQQLWLEFWQEVLSMDSPSEELKALLTNTVDNLCK